MSKILELAKKLKELSDRGEGGEKKNAAQFLSRLLEQNGMTIDDIEGEKMSSYAFSYKRGQDKLLIQIITMVVGRDIDIYTERGPRLVYLIDCTPSQYIEIKAAFEFYWRAYEEELHMFYTAFVHKNNLFPKDNGEVKTKQISIEEYRKLQRMMDGVDMHHYRKQLK